MGAILGTIGSILVGGAVAAATIVGVVQSNTAKPDVSPTSVNAPVVDYGSN
jgi:hypothetical protein